MRALKLRRKTDSMINLSIKTGRFVLFVQQVGRSGKWFLKQSLDTNGWNCVIKKTKLKKKEKQVTGKVFKSLIQESSSSGGLIKMKRQRTMKNETTKSPGGQWNRDCLRLRRRRDKTIKTPPRGKKTSKRGMGWKNWRFFSDPITFIVRSTHLNGTTPGNRSAGH